jgi:hypothetical protein
LRHRAIAPADLRRSPELHALPVRDRRSIDRRNVVHFVIIMKEVLRMFQAHVEDRSL